MAEKSRTLRRDKRVKITPPRLEGWEPVGFEAELDGNWASLYSKIPNQPLHQGIQVPGGGAGFMETVFGLIPRRTSPLSL